MLGIGAFSFDGYAQNNSSNFIEKQFVIDSEIIAFDSISILPSSFEIKLNNVDIDKSLYEVDYLKSELTWKGELPINVLISYRKMSINFQDTYQHKSVDDRRFEDSLKMVPFRYGNSNNSQDIFGTSSLDKSGSISRGVAVGNNQDLSVNSDLNLQLSGKISDEISILASISDDNIPIQPQGNTQQLQDFDQVYIQLFTDKWKITAGDFWMKKPAGYFMKYNKKVQGGSFEYHGKNTFSRLDSSSLNTRASVAISKGKFGRNVIQGVENNQGPYRLSGAEGEQFIIVLSGTEMVYIDGELLVRGQDNDYIIDYNSSEITFTANRLITKDKRITVEFQYSDKNYARTIIESNTEVKLNDWDVHFNLYSEQDAKNQPLQQLLDDNDKLVLYNAGDNPLLALTSGIDSSGFDDNSNKYELIDTLGYSVLNLSIDPDLAVYNAVFSNVGTSNGDYIESDFNAFGKVFEWIAPDTIGGEISHNGSFAPVRLLVAPKQRQMFTGGAGKQISKGIRTGVEFAYTKTDVNTFSELDAGDNEGYAATFKFDVDRKLNNEWRLLSKTKFEFTSEDFQYVERYRAVEFTRNWNATTLTKGNQILGTTFINLKKSNWLSLNYGIDFFQQEEDYVGFKNHLNTKVNKVVDFNYAGSWLISESENSSNFYRHKGSLSKTFGKLKIGYADELEDNRYMSAVSDSLSAASYSFFDYQFYLASSDSSTNKFKVFYRERNDKKTNGGVLNLGSRAINPGLSLELLKNKNQQFTFKLNYRRLTIDDTSLTLQQPEEVILNRVEYRSRFFKGGITSTMFYEVGSGLELKREFAYIEVPAGQGVYTWVDYNGDEIKDINEFEIAQYQDQSTYLRVTTPSNDYIKIFSNQFSEVLNVNFRNIFKSKSRFSTFIGRFNTQSTYKIERKTNLTDLLVNLNPFAPIPDDENLQSMQQSIRHSTFFNRTNSKFGLEHTFIGLNSKNLLSSGFDQRTRNSNIFKLRINLSRKFTVLASNEYEIKGSYADYTQGRDYELTNIITEGKLSFQPNTSMRISLLGGYKDKRNSPQFSFGEAFISEAGIEGKWNQVKKGSLTGSLKYAKIIYAGDGNSALAYEMLESLQPGDNAIWTIGYQRTFANNLQLTINYNGRKSQDNSAIHSGGMQLRAFF